MRVLCTSSASSDSGHVRRVGRVTVLSLHWLHGRVIQIDDQVLVNRVLVGRL